MVSGGPGALTDQTLSCPHCGSSRTASRRQLFHWLMAETGTPGYFAWYHDQLPRALPPSSLVVLPGLLLIGMMLPMMGLWLLGHVLALQWLAALALIVLLALLFDIFSTFRRYQQWGRQWLCAECRLPFTSVETQDIDPGHFPQRG